MEITKELINSFKTDMGGYTAVTIGILSAIAGVRHGWKMMSIGKEISPEAIALIENDVHRRNNKLLDRAVKSNGNKLHLSKRLIRNLLKESRSKRNKKRQKERYNKINSLPKYNGDVNSPEFLKSYEWRKVRMIVLKRDGAKCACCGASPATGAVMNVDHIKPRKTHPRLSLDPQNLQVLCHECNHGKGNWDDTKWRQFPEKVVLLKLVS